MDMDNIRAPRPVVLKGGGNTARDGVCAFRLPAGLIVGQLGNYDYIAAHGPGRRFTAQDHRLATELSNGLDLSGDHRSYAAGLEMKMYKSYPHGHPRN